MLIITENNLATLKLWIKNGEKIFLGIILLIYLEVKLAQK